MVRADRLSALDAAFLFMETDVQPLHVGFVLILEGPPPTYDQFTELVARRVSSVTWLRRRVMHMPGNLGRPIWVDFDDWALEEHLTHVVLPGPGDDDRLRALVAQIMSQRLDVSRPLFELWQVDGLRGDRWAIIAKAHHTLVDGVSGTDLIQCLLGDAGGSGVATEPGGVCHAAPTRFAVFAWGARWVLHLPLRLLGAAARAVASPRETARALRRIRHGLDQVVKPDLPPSSLNGPLGRTRLWGDLSIDLDDLRPVTDATGCTVNDVVLAAVTGGLRQYLLDRGEPLEEMTLRAIVPVSGRSPDHSLRPGTVASAMFLEMPVHLSGPLERLDAVHRSLAAQKAEGVAGATAALVHAADHVPWPVVVRAATRYAARGQRRVNVAVTNVPGPRLEQRFGGRRLLALLPYVPVALDVRTSFALVSYAGRLSLGVTADRVSHGDLDALIDAIRAALDELAGPDRPPLPGHRGVGVRRPGT